MQKRTGKKMEKLKRIRFPMFKGTVSGDEYFPKTISTFWRADLNEFKLDYLNCSTKNILPILKILTKTFFIY